MKKHSVINYFLCLDLKSEGNSLPFKSFLHDIDHRFDIQITLYAEQKKKKKKKKQIYRTVF